MQSSIGRLLARSSPILAGAFVAVALASTATLYATTTTNGGITLTTPSYSISVPLYHCEPQNDPTAATITVSGIPTNSTLKVNFTFSSGLPNTPLIQIPLELFNVTGTVTIAIPYPEDVSTWPGFDGTNRIIVVAAAVAVTPPGGTTIKLTSKQWKVICHPDVPDNGFNGCTLGYWKQDQHFGSWTGFVPGDFYDAVFGVDSNLNPPGNEGAYANPTLLQALEIGGGGENGMARQAVAALLNSTSPGVNYQLTTAQVIAIVYDAYHATNPEAAFNAAHVLFESYNLSLVNGVHTCPLGRDELPEP
jgi:hypothetical protein